MFLSKRFLALLRQYASLEDSMNVPYTPQISAFAYSEVDRLIASGVEELEAFRIVNQALVATVRRFPVQIDPIPF